MNVKRTDIQLDSTTKDILIKNGDLCIGDTMAQNQYLILVMQKGELKADPLHGVGITDMLNDNDVMGWKRKIRDGLKDDGMVVSKLSMNDDGSITELEAEYK